MGPVTVHWDNQGNYEEAILENENNNYIIDDYSDYEPEHKH